MQKRKQGKTKLVVNGKIIKFKMEIFKKKEKIRICADCIALIHLSKIGIINKILDSGQFTIIITPSEEEEIKKEEKENESEGKDLSELIKNNKIMVEVPYKNLELVHYGLRNAELEVVSHFLDNKCDLILADDAIIRENTEILNLKIISTPSFILNLFERKILDKQKTIGALIALRHERWFEEWIIDECIRRVKEGKILD